MMLELIELFARSPAHWAIVFVLNIFVAYVDLISDGKLKDRKSTLPRLPLFWFYLAYYPLFSLLAVLVVSELGLLDDMGYSHAIALGLLPSTLLKNRISLIGKVTDDNTLNLNPFRFFRESLEEDIIKEVYNRERNWFSLFSYPPECEEAIEEVLFDLADSDIRKKMENIKKYNPDSPVYGKIKTYLKLLVKSGIRITEIEKAVDQVIKSKIKNPHEI